MANLHESKACRTCKVVKPYDDFYKYGQGDKRRGDCKGCQKEINRQWVASNRAKVREYQRKNRQQNPDQHRDYKYRSAYGITLEQYNKILEYQEGRCAICHNKPRKQNLAVDHNHKTGEVRGLLCRFCNHRLLGGAKERIDILERAISYLTDPPAREILNHDGA